MMHVMYRYILKHNTLFHVDVPPSIFSYWRQQCIPVLETEMTFFEFLDFCEILVFGCSILLNVSVDARQPSIRPTPVLWNRILP